MSKPKNKPCARCETPHVGRTPSGHEYETCSGHAKSGKACGRPPAKGQKVCGTHGGSSPQALAKAEEVLSEKAAEKLAHKWGVPIETSPMDAILGRIAAYSGHVKFYLQKVEEVLEAPSITTRVYDEEDEERQSHTSDSLVWGMTRNKVGGDDAGTTYEAKPNIWLNLYNDASDRVVKYSAEAHRAGIDERQIKLAEDQGDLVVDVLTKTADAILDALEAAGLPEQFAEIFEATLAEAAPRFLRLLYGGAP